MSLNYSCPPIDFMQRSEIKQLMTSLSKNNENKLKSQKRSEDFTQNENLHSKNETANNDSIISKADLIDPIEYNPHKFHNSKSMRANPVRTKRYLIEGDIMPDTINGFKDFEFDQNAHTQV